MSGRKNQLPSYQSITDGDMSGNLTSDVTDIRYMDNISIQLVFTGTPTGAFSVEGSLDYNRPDPTTGVTNPGTWTAMSFTTPPVASGAAGTILLDLNQLSFPFIRVTYTAGSGSGTLQCWVSGKAV